MASQQQSGRAASKARRQMQVNGKGRSAAAPAPTRQPNRKERKPVSAANPAPAPAPQAAAPVASNFVAPASMPTPRRAQKSASRLRRESLAARGKVADKSKDRQLTSDMAMKRRSAADAKAGKGGDCGCGGPCCQEAEAKAAAAAPAPAVSAPSSNGVQAKRKPIVNASSTGRMLSRARRAAMAGRGKAGLEAHGKNSSASIARQANPDISARDLARTVRESRSKNGSRGCTAAAPARSRRPRNAAEAKQISGTEVAHSAKTTGDEVGLCRSITGTDYLSNEVFSEFCQSTPPAVPSKVKATSTLSGGSVTSGGVVGRSEKVTGDERGSCYAITGSEYVGKEHYDDFCKGKPEPGSAKVSFSQTTRGQVVSGSKPARSEKVTGDEAGTCKAVTGTPYAGSEQYEQYCKPSDSSMARARTVVRSGNAGRDITGLQPGLDNLTGAEKGACKTVSGTAYTGADQMQTVCGVSPAQVGQSDFPQPIEGAPWGAFSVIDSPVHASKGPGAGAITGTSYDQEQGRISGTFSLGEGKVTGTEQFRFGEGGRAANIITPTPKPDASEKVSRVTGEGMNIGIKISGDDWDRGERVTGTEGTSSVKRNPTRRGPISAMPENAPKRNEEVAQSDINVTGGSGTFEKGALITVSGGARG